MDGWTGELDRPYWRSVCLSVCHVSPSGLRVGQQAASLADRLHFHDNMLVRRQIISSFRFCLTLFCYVTCSDRTSTAAHKSAGAKPPWLKIAVMWPRAVGQTSLSTVAIGKMGTQLGHNWGYNDCSRVYFDYTTITRSVQGCRERLIIPRSFPILPSLWC